MKSSTVEVAFERVSGEVEYHEVRGEDDVRRIIANSSDDFKYIWFETLMLPASRNNDISLGKGWYLVDYETKFVKR